MLVYDARGGVCAPACKASADSVMVGFFYCRPEEALLRLLRIHQIERKLFCPDVVQSSQLGTNGSKDVTPRHLAAADIHHWTAQGVGECAE